VEPRRRKPLGSQKPLGSGHETLGSTFCASTTTWQYDARRGWLSAKRYADGKGPEYEYSPSGKIKSRKWARGIATGYGYTTAGELASIQYSDGQTATVKYEFDRLGRKVKTIQGDQKTLLIYNDAGQLVSEIYEGGNLDKLGVFNQYDAFHRRTALEARNGSSITSQSFTYDDASRLETVSEGDDTASYSYVANSPLVGQIEFSHNGTKRMTTTKQYDRLNRLKQIQSGMGVSPISSFAYDYNAANQRVKASLEDGSAWDYAYDSLGQVTSGKKLLANRASEPDESFDYQHDDIGNRKEAGGQASARTSYAANALNQYTQRVDTQAPNKTETLQYDTDGNLIADGTWKYSWDAENRLMAMESGLGVSPGQRQRLEFAYDTQSRRISKRVYAWESARSNFSLQPSAFSLFVYDGWNLLAELTSDLRPLTSFVWGIDLSGSSQGAGGVGGLLFISDKHSGSPNAHAVAYDGNGNVVTLVDSQSGTESGRYVHGPFGETITASGAMAKANPFRFSTKYTDDETDLVYFGFRYYRPSSGKWLSRDPLGEKHESNLYVVVDNNPINKNDYLGLFTLDNTCGYAPGTVTRITDQITDACTSRLMSLVTDTTSPLYACIWNLCYADGKVHLSVSKPRVFSLGRGTYINLYGDAPDLASGWGGGVNVNLYPLQGNSSVNWGDVVIHEFAHCCMWSHGNSGLAASISGVEYGGGSL